MKDLSVLIATPHVLKKPSSTGDIILMCIPVAIIQVILGCSANFFIAANIIAAILALLLTNLKITVATNGDPIGIKQPIEFTITKLQYNGLKKQ
jgi:hypothetical protein